MATASSNLARLRYIPEATYGTTPSTGTSKDLRFTGESLAFAIKTDTSKEIRADRQISDLVQLDADASGDVNIELSYGTFDDFIAAALGADWATDVVKNGTQVKFFSIEQGFTDINQYILYKGMAASTMSLDFASGSILTGKFGFVGNSAVRANATGVPAAGAAGELTEVMNATSNFADLTIGGTAYPCGISKISLATDGGLRQQKSVGHLGACSINPGTFKITGDITAYFSDGTIYDKYIANSAFSLSWSVSDAAGNKYAFLLPRVKVTTAKVNAGQLDQDVELTMSYQALFDATAGDSIEITRTPAP